MEERTKRKYLIEIQFLVKDIDIARPPPSLSEIVSRIEITCDNLPNGILQLDYVKASTERQDAGDDDEAEKETGANFN